MADTGFVAPPHEELVRCVQTLDEPIAKRMRAVFYLRTEGTEAAAEALCRAMELREGSTLFRHEIAYCLGQMRQRIALPALERVLRDVEDDAIVRHEVRGGRVGMEGGLGEGVGRKASERAAQCAEALAAIGAADSLPLLREFVDDKRVEVSETCAIAVRSLEWQAEAGSAGVAARDTRNPYESVDPAPPSDVLLARAEEAASALRVESEAALEKVLMDGERSLFDRYAAMFALRNLGTPAAIEALERGLLEPSSALFRHEVAYVLGQIQSPLALRGLAARLADRAEHPMARHEAAESLGAIGTAEACELLRAFLDDPEQVVRESCVVALDAVDYWTK
jgi:deoxyhypusine monooxygenase